MKRITVISDTRGLLRPEVNQIINGCDAILHGGDIRLTVLSHSAPKRGCTF